MSRSVVYTLHLHPPVAHARHYTGSTRELAQRLADHALGRGARLTQVQIERGGSWVLAQAEPGGRGRERQLKNQGGATRRCQVCKAVDGYQAGKLTQQEPLTRAGWDRANQVDRSTLLGIFGLPQAPQPGPPARTPVETRLRVPAPRADPLPVYSQELHALADALIDGWTNQKAETEAGAEAEAGAELEAGA